MTVLLAVLAFATGHAQGIGEGRLAVGLMQGLGDHSQTTTPAGAASFAFTVGPVALGPEAQFGLGDDRRIVTLGGMARVSLGKGPLEPYLTAGLGWYSWRPRGDFVSLDLFSGSLGAGLALHRGSPRLAVTLEGRYHDNLQNTDAPGSRRLVSLMAGALLRW